MGKENQNEYWGIYFTDRQIIVDDLNMETKTEVMKKIQEIQKERKDLKQARSQTKDKAKINESGKIISNFKTANFLVLDLVSIVSLLLIDR